MNFKQAVTSKKLIFPEYNVFGFHSAYEVFIVPSDDVEFFFYMEKVSKMKWSELTDETAIEYALKENYSYAILTNDLRGIFYERLFVRAGIEPEFVNSIEHLFSKDRSRESNFRNWFN